MAKPSYRRRRLLQILRFLLTSALAVVGLYAAYVLLSYHRLPDSAEQHSSNNKNVALLHQEYSATTWNIGFGAYGIDFSFFMDGGLESRARSTAAVFDNMVRVIDVLMEEDADFMLLQEVDRRADRSWHIEEVDLVREAFPDLQNYYAQNYNSPYLFYPVKKPYGATRSGLLTLSKLDIFRSERRSLPVEKGLMKLLDLDRCFSICRVPVENGKQLCLYNLHLSAYTADGGVTTEQIRKLIESMQYEYRVGNYVVAGGDFSKDLAGHSDRIFGVPGVEATWALPIDRSLIPDGLRLVESMDRKHPLPTSRSCDMAYIPGTTFVLTRDGFIVSDNVTVVECRVIDDGFAASYHNPVKLTFSLNENAEVNRYEMGPFKAVPGL